MMKKRLCAFIVSVLTAFVGLSLSSCTGSTSITGISMASEETIDIPFGNFTYDDVKVDVHFDNGTKTTIDLKEEMIPMNERLKFYKMGEQDILVLFREKYSTVMKVNVVLNQFKDIYKLEDLVVTYDGLPHSVAINEELPEGATIQYPYGNTFTNVGTYEIVGVISKTGYESKTLNATLTINKNQRDSDQIEFNDATFVYNGEMKTVEATNVPEGVTVNYKIYDYETGADVNKILSVGKYKVDAIFVDSNPNYKKIENMTSIVTVVKGDYDMSSHQLLNVVRTYDGKDYLAHVENEDSLPDDVTVEIKYYDMDGNLVDHNRNSGTYTMVASFSNEDVFNYNPIKDMEATLIVNPIEVNVKNKVFFNGVYWDFGGDPIPLSVVIGDDFPEDYKTMWQAAFYKDNGDLYHNGDFVYAGKYPVHCVFSSTNKNVEFVVNDLNSYVTIDPVTEQIEIIRLTIETDSTTGKKYAKVVTDEYGVVLRSIAFTTIPTTENPVAEPVDIENIVPGVMYNYKASFTYENERMASSVVIPDVAGVYPVPTSVDLKQLWVEKTSPTEITPHIITDATESVQIDSLTFYNKTTGNVVTPEAFDPDGEYNFSLKLRYTNDLYNKQYIIPEITGSYPYVMDVNIDSIIIAGEPGARTITFNTDVAGAKVESLSFYTIATLEEPSVYKTLDQLNLNSEYTFVVQFYFDDAVKDKSMTLHAVNGRLPFIKNVNILSLVVEGGVANITTDVAGVSLNSIQFYTIPTEDEPDVLPVDITHLEDGVEYSYVATLRFTNADYNNAMSIPQVEGTYLYEE